MKAVPVSYLCLFVAVSSAPEIAFSQAEIDMLPADFAGRSLRIPGLAKGQTTQFFEQLHGLCGRCSAG